MKVKLSILAVCFFGLTAVPGLGVLTIYTDRNLWESAVSDFTTEDFSSVPLGSISRDEGPLGSIRFLVSGPEPPVTDLRPVIEDAGAINGSREFVGNLYGLTPRVLGPTSYTFIFPSGVRAWGADFATAASAGSLLVDFAGDTLSVEDELGAPGTGFVGFVSSNSASTMDFRLRNSTFTEFFQMDDFSFSPVPEPSGVVLFCFGFAISLLRRIRPTYSTFHT